MGDVDRDGEVRSDLEGRGPRSEQPDLLLHRRDGGEAAGERATLVAAPQRLQGHVGAEAVVHRPGDEAIAGQAHRLGGDHDWVADADQLSGLVAVGDTDVYVQALQLDHLLALVGVEQVDRLAADDTGHQSVPAANLDPLADEDLRVPTADRGEPEEALLVDVGDDEADLVDVADDGEQRLGLADAGDRGAEAVGGECGEGGFLAPDRRGRPLVARGGAGAQQLVEEGGGFGHSKLRSMPSRTDVRNQPIRIVFSSMSEAAKTFLVTGASSGIGEATAKRLAREPGAELILVARREERLRALAESLPCEASWLAVDLTEADAPERVRAHLAEHHGGRLSLLVNNAGASWRGSFADAGYANVQRHMELNFDAVARLTEALLPGLRASAPSSIVNVASTAGRVARARTGAYSASKFALIGWTDALYAEERPHGVHVGMVLPGFIETEGFPATELREKR